MHLKIDRDECTSCGVCWDECPDIFEENTEDGWSQIVKSYRSGGNAAEGDIPDELEECAQKAADSCPVEIIHLE